MKKTKAQLIAEVKKIIRETRPVNSKLLDAVAVEFYKRMELQRKLDEEQK